MSAIKIAIGVARLKFLTLAAVCVLLGVACAWWQYGAFNAFNFTLVMVGALAAQASVNAFNEYFDFKSGLDLATERTPFSGGSGTLPANPEGGQVALAFAWVTMALVIVLGLLLVSRVGTGLLPLGLLGVVIIYTYTQYLNKSPLLCLLAPGLGFGPLIALGSFYAMAGQFSLTAVLVSLVAMFLVSNVLLLNQFPDVEADKTVGRNHLPIQGGLQLSAKVFIFQLVAALGLTLALVLVGKLPVWAMLGLVPVVVLPKLIPGVLRDFNDTERFVPYLGMNVMIAHLMPLGLALGMWLAAKPVV